MARYGRKVHLDDDVAEALEQVASNEGVSRTEMANRVLRGQMIATSDEDEEARIVETNPDQEEEEVRIVETNPDQEEE